MSNSNLNCTVLVQKGITNLEQQQPPMKTFRNAFIEATFVQLIYSINLLLSRFHCAQKKYDHSLMSQHGPVHSTSFS